MLNNHRYFRRNGILTTMGYYPLSMGAVKRAIILNQHELIYRFQSYLVENCHLTDDDYHQNSPFIPLSDTHVSEMEDWYSYQIDEVQKQYGNDRSQLLINQWKDILNLIITETSLKNLINKYLHLLETLDSFGFNFINNKKVGNFSILEQNQQLVLIGHIDSEDDHTDKLELPRLNCAELLKLVCNINMKNRHATRNPTTYEYLAVQIAFEAINVHGFTESCIVPWGNPGFRNIQTQASITDPGLGHVTGTLSSMDYINGTNVHIEYLERGGEENREKVEPYRIPNTTTIAQIKLLAGEDTTVTSYVGRPMFEDTFENSFIKTLNTMSAVVSSIFMEGLTECKVAMERMTATQQVQFMRSLAANAIRDKSLQILSAAYAINVPIIDDRPETLAKNNGQALEITDRMAVAELGIELAHQGGFEKVTFDGTANSYPSIPVMEQLGFENALTLVHQAHSYGLLTYFSAGFRYKHLEDIVLSGTDGIGLGGAQILRFMDKNNGFQGPFKTSNVKDILEINQKAENSVLGRGTQLLTRMDQMAYEQSLPIEYSKYRDELFHSLLEKNSTVVQEQLYQLSEIVDLPTDTTHPMLATAQRILKFADRSNAFNSKKMSQEFIQRLKVTMKNAITLHDYDTLYEIVHMIESNKKESVL